MIKAQTDEWGGLEKKAASEKQWLVNEEGILVLVTKSGPIIVIPKLLRQEALNRVHGDADVGHFGLTRTAVRLISKFFWQGWREDLKQFIKKCFKMRDGKTREIQVTTSGSTKILPGDPPL